MYNVFVPAPVIIEICRGNYQTAKELLDELVPFGNCSIEYLNSRTNGNVIWAFGSEWSWEIRGK